MDAQPVLVFAVVMCAVLAMGLWLDAWYYRYRMPPSWLMALIVLAAAEALFFFTIGIALWLITP